MELEPAKKLGFGLMRLPLLDKSDDAAVDIEKVKLMVDRFLEKGFTYFDTAWMYHGFESENVARKALVERHPRESFTLATKLHSTFFHSPEERDTVFNKQLEKTGAGYFDYYLVHGIDKTNLQKYEDMDCFRFVLDKREKGMVRYAGFSFHESAEILDDLLTRHPGMDFIQLQLNYLDWESEWIQSRKCCEVAEKHHMPVVVMEPVKGGTLANIPDEAKKIFEEVSPGKSPSSFALRFAAGLPGVIAVLSGMNNLEQIEENTDTFMDFEPLNEKEKAACTEVAKIINSKITVPCTGCSYCTDGCPKNIPIPKYFSLYNEDMRENMEEKGWGANYSSYEVLAKEKGMAGDCVGCGQCEGVCPQHLPIIRYLKDVAKHFEIF